MIWKTTLAFLVAFIRNLEDFPTSRKILLNPVFSILTLIGFSASGNAQTCVITEDGCPPTDISVACGSEVVNNVYGNYVNWSPPTYELNCGTGDGDAFQMSFDLPESGSDCWIFNKVQRVGTNNGTLNLWKSDGNASGTAEVTTPAFYIDGETSGSMTIIAAPGQSFTTKVFLVNSDGLKSGLMDSFVVNQTTTLYNYSVNSDLFEGTSSYRLKFEFTGGTNNASYVDLITFDANLFGNSCSGDVNFSVTSNYVPNDFFPVGTTEVVYTAICLGCSPVVTNTCRFNVIVNPIPTKPVVLEIVQPSCEESLGSIEVTRVNGMRYSIDGENFSTSTLFENLVPDTYYITAINSANCESVPLEVVINSQPETPVAEITNNNGLDLSCNIPSTILTATGGETYSWSDGVSVVGTAASLEVSSAGTFTVTVIASNGCSAIASAIVRENKTEAVAAITGNETLTCKTASIILDAGSSTADGTVSYLWNDGTSGSTLTVTTPGNYSVTVTGSNGCSDSATVTVNQNITEAVATITGNETLTCENTSVTLDASTSNADGILTYLWNDGTSGSTLTVTTPGNYSVTVTGSNGCSDSATVTVDQNITEAVASITGNDILTCDNPSVTLSAGTSTADGTVSYLWNNGTTGSTLTVTIPGNYSVKVTGSNGCSDSATVTVDQNITDALARITGNDILTCDNTSVTLDASTSTADGTLTYLWNDGTSGSTLTATTPGNYSVTVTGSNGCSDLASVTVSQNTTTSKAVITGNEILTCNTTSITLDAGTSTADGEITYLWSNGANTAAIIVDEPGTYSVTITGENGCSDGASVQVQQNITEAVANISGNAVLTCDVTSVTLDASASTADGEFTYLWSNGAITSSINVNEPGAYSVTITGENGCFDDASVTVVQNITPTTAVITGNEILTCETTSVTLDAGSSTADGEVTYLWSNNSNEASITVSEPGIYSVTITGENGCSDQASVTVEQNTTTSNAVITGNEILTCNTTSITLDAGTSTADGEITYLWSNGATTASITVDEPGTYSVTITGENGCSDGASAEVEQNITPANVVITGNEILTCNTTSITLDASTSTADGKFTYLWNTGATTASINVNESGAYSVTITGENGCFDDASVTVEQNINPATAVITGNEILTCETTSVTLDAGSSTADGEVTYLWSNNSNEASITVNEPGVYSVTITGENGCSDNASVTVEQNTTTSNAVITGNEILTCNTTTVTLDAGTSTADGEITYLWSNAATTASITVDEPGTYSVTITGENGCSDGASAEVEQNITEAVASITGNGTLTCVITSITLDASSSTADGNVSYLWSDGTTASTLNVSAPGTYSVTITGENGCFNESSVTVVQNITPATAVITGNEILTCETTSVTLDAGSSTADGEVTYLWSNNSNEASITVNEPGVYSVTITGENGCSDNTSVTVEQNTTTSNAVITGNEILTCNTTTVTLDAGTSTADGEITYLWSNGATTASITVDEPGTYSVTITGENGCSDGASAEVEQNITEAVANITGNAVLTCVVTSITLDASTSTADGEFTYLWNNGATSASINVNEPGAYSVTITGENGCFDDASVTVEQNINPATAVITGNEKLTCETTSVTLDAGSSTADGEVTYLWSNNSTEASITVNEPGVYSVTITGENGCFDNASVTVEQNTTTASAVITGNEILDCNTTSITLDASSSTADGIFTYLWSNGSTESTLSVNEAGTYSVIITGENGCSNETSETVVFVPDTENPEVEKLKDISINVDNGNCSAIVEYSLPTSTDNCSGSVVTLDEGSLTSGSAFPVGTTTVNYTAKDASGNTTSVSFTVTVIDNEAPVANVAELPTVTGECSATVSAVPTATDNCGGTINGTTEDSLTYTEQGTYTVTWTFNDGNGNISTQTQTVIVEDVTAPVANVAELPTVTGECSATVSVVPTATDNCGGTINGNTEDALTYTEQGTYSVTWTFNDGNGNTSTQTQTVIVDDTTAPVANVAELPTVTGECSATVSVVPTATDNCGGTINGTTEDALTYTEQGTYSVTWTFNDGNGNTSTQTQTVIVDDTTAPVANIAELPTVTGECSATVSVVPTATDNCGGIINGTTQDALTYTEQGTYTVIWTFNDGNGNTSTQTQTVIVDDVTAPVADVAELPTVTGECSATVSAVPTATDNCGGTINGTTQDTLTYTEQGTYTLTWTFNDGNGNTSTQTQTVIVDDVTAPVVAGEIIQPTCDVATGSFSVTVIEGLQYSINGTDYSVSGSFTGLAAGTYNVTARTAAGCVSEALTVTINNQPLTIETPVVAATIQPTCEISTGSFSITEVEGLEYSFNGGEYASTTSFEDLTPGNYTVTARNAEGCVSEELSVTINALQGTPAAPLTVQLVQPICDVQYGSFSITSVEGMEYSINGSTFGSNTSFSNLEPGNYNVIARNSDGCVSEATSVTINPVPADCVVGPCELSDVKDSISKAVTPNGDGFNDSFNVGLDLECDFTYAVQIFNRWGAEIYKDRNYQNNWDGYSNKSITSSNQLPSGTYYYILEVTDTNGNRLEPIQGYIYLGTK